jgi:hypothetical protein
MKLICLGSEYLHLRKYVCLTRHSISIHNTVFNFNLFIIDKCRICGTEGETIEHIISSCTVLAQSEYKKRHVIFAKIIHMNLAVKFNLLMNTQPHYSYTPESCLENDNYKLYFDRTVLTDIHIKHNRPDIINKQQKQAYLLDIPVPNSHNITQTYNTKINKYLELSVAMRNLWCLEKISMLPLDPIVFTPTIFRHTKRLPIRISRPSHKKFHFKNLIKKEEN